MKVAAQSQSHSSCPNALQRTGGEAKEGRAIAVAVAAAVALLASNIVQTYLECIKLGGEV